jgi:hypothetical protein
MAKGIKGKVHEERRRSEDGARAHTRTHHIHIYQKPEDSGEKFIGKIIHR